MKKIVFTLILISLITTCREQPLFVNLTSTHTNITFQNKITTTNDLNILNYLYFYNGSGVSVADFNNDGLTDIFFTANQTADKLFLNKGNLRFVDVTLTSGIKNENHWTTGSTTVDINNDGLLDIYICKVGDYNGIKGRNLLYINKGIRNGILHFKEEAHLYGLDFVGFSTQAVFFDYDVDGDLDMFLLNHSLHPNSNYGKGSSRLIPDEMSGDKLFENLNGQFVDVTLKSGIFQSKIGYGLGVSVSDINLDGYPDIYVGNDFFENDYLYINQKNKTFQEQISRNPTLFGHTTRFSMGNSINDINNDGWPDIISLDMLPEDLTTYRASGQEYPYQIYERQLKSGYGPQFMQNTLHLNNRNGTFSETGFLSGIAATEWSWSPLVADFNNDGFKDLYVTNGILGATNDMDYINFLSNETIQKQLDSKVSEQNLAIIEDIPTKKTYNYVFKNNGNNTFRNVSKSWTLNNESYSNGGAFADLDNDGDLDVVISNINEESFLLKNTQNNTKSNNFLKVRYIGSSKNKFGIGTKTQVFIEGFQMLSENYTTTGYLSSVEPKSHFGLGLYTKIDSLVVVWPDGKYQSIKNVSCNQEIVLNYNESSGNYYQQKKKIDSSILSNTTSLINFKHSDGTSLEFNRDPLIPFASTNKGPVISVVDVNNDSLQDLFVGGAKRQPSELFIQTKDGLFESNQNEIFNLDALNEDVSQTFFHANPDSFKDLIVLSGGNEFKSGKPLNPRLYINNKGILIQDTLQFKNLTLNASKVTTVDFDNDGDQDVCFTSDLIPWKFGATPEQYFFENDGYGNFRDITSIFAEGIKHIGNVQDILWVDINGDSLKDAIVVGHWMPISIFINNGNKLTLQSNNNLSKTNGWWNSIEAVDFDNDLDLDLVAGNWGLNTRLAASENYPITLYRNDFDDNASIEPLVTYYYNGIETPIATKDELSKQMPFLNKKYLSYNDFANASLKELLTKEKLENSHIKYVYELASCYFENLGNNTFQKHHLPFNSQVSSVNDIFVDDFDNDGFSDLFLVGNIFEISTQLSKLDASHGQILINDKSGFFNDWKHQNFKVSGAARSIAKIDIKNTTYYLVSKNNDSITWLKKKE